jgi:hypothetical protein
MWTMSITVSVSLCVLLAQAKGAVTPAEATLLATKVYDTLQTFSQPADANRMTFLYVHYENDLTKPHYTNAVVHQQFQGTKRIRMLYGKTTPYWPAPEDMPKENDSPIVADNLMVAPFPKAGKKDDLTVILVPLKSVNSLKCPKLVIFGRKGYTEKAVEIEGWPKGDDGYFNLTNNIKNVNVCNNTEFFYYIHEKLNDERVLELLAENNVNVDYNSYHSL